MRVVISEACLQKLFELPKEVQKSTLDFKRKFEKDSKLGSIHLEPISTFKDKNLRTARINQKYRAIVRIPESDANVYYLLWVDNHDEAMNWAKNKVFEWNESLQAAQIYVVPEETVVEENISSHQSDSEVVLAAHLFDDFTNEQLLAIGVPQNLLLLVRQIKDLTSLDNVEAQLPSEVYEHLFYLADGVNIQIILAEIAEGKKMNDGVNSTNNRRHFIEVDDDVLEKYLNGELEKWQLFLHPSQRSLVEKEFKASVKVTGGAGTGKTVVALHRLLHLTRMNDITDERPILFCTFTKALKDNLLDLIVKMGIDRNRYELNNIDALAWKLAAQFNLLSERVHVLDMKGVKRSQELWEEVVSEELTSFDSRFLYEEYQSVILNNGCKDDKTYFATSRVGRGKPISRKDKIEIWELVKNYEKRKEESNYVDRYELFNRVTDYLNMNDIRLYTHVIVDEIQDFSNVELRFVRALTEAKANDLFMVGDPFQNIYGKKISFIKSGINIQGLRSKQLRINYRTTEEIKRVAVKSVKGITCDNFEGNIESLDGYYSMYHGDQPQYFCFDTTAEQNEKLLNYMQGLLNTGIYASDIVIGVRTKEELKELKKLKHQNNIPLYDLTDKTGDRNGVRISTLHSMKGLEFKYVILYGINNMTMPYMPNKSYLWDEVEKNKHKQSERSLLYVAMTRAVKQLIILGSGVKCDLIQI